MEAREKPKPNYFLELSAETKENLEKQGFYVVSLPLSAQKKSRYRHIAINLKQMLGKGTYAFVYQAYPINPETNQLESTNKFKMAAKIFKKRKEFDLQEAQRFNQYYHVDAVVGLDSKLLNLPEEEKKSVSPFGWPSSNKAKQKEDKEEPIKICMLMEYLPGKEISRFNKLDVDIQKLTLAQRIRMVYQVALAINNLHHETSTKSALLHGDIKGENLRFYIGELDEEKQKENEEKKKQNIEVEDKIHVFITDFGFSQKLDDDPNAPVVESEIKGTGFYIPYELFYREIGIKSDIPALVPLFALILGAQNPLKSKQSIAFTDLQFKEKLYNFKDLFTNLNAKQYPLDLFKYTFAFLSRMQEPIYENRADIDEVLKFFSLLDKFCRMCDARAKQTEISDEDLKKVLTFTADESLQKYLNQTQDPNLKNILQTKKNDLEEGQLTEYLTPEQISRIKIYLKNIDKENFDNFLITTQAKLILLAAGLWRSSFEDTPKIESSEKDSINHFFKTKPKEAVQASQQLANYDFDSNIPFCKEIIKEEKNFAFKDKNTLWNMNQIEEYNKDVLNQLKENIKQHMTHQRKRP